MLIPWYQSQVSMDDYPGSEGSPSLQARLVDPAAESQETKLYRKELVQLVRRALGKLNARERHIISNRFGILGGGEGTLDEIASGLDLSRERVRQLERVAKDRLRQELRCCAPNPWLA